MAAQPELREVQWKPRAAGRDKKRPPARGSALFLNRSRRAPGNVRCGPQAAQRRDDAPGLRARNFRTAAMIRKIVGFYRDGFRGMTVGRTLWCIVLLKLLLFGVLRPLFFRDPMAGRSVAECGTAVLERLTDVENPLSDP